MCATRGTFLAIIREKLHGNSIVLVFGLGSHKSQWLPPTYGTCSSSECVAANT